jgi:predicted HTH transcriptional regulator
MKSVYHVLKKRYQYFSPNEDLDELVSFLWVNEFLLNHSTPIKKEDLALILDQCKYLEMNGTGFQKLTSFGLEYYNMAPIMKAVETYLKEHKDNSSKDTYLLFNILKRLTQDEEDPIEPSIIDIEALLLERPVEKLIELIEKSRIAREIL